MKVIQDKLKGFACVCLSCGDISPYRPTEVGAVGTAIIWGWEITSETLCPDCVDNKQVPKILPKPYSLWRHLKSKNEYLVLFISKHTENSEFLVNYVSFPETFMPWARPLNMFLDGRFEEVKLDVKAEAKLDTFLKEDMLAKYVRVYKQTESGGEEKDNLKKVKKLKSAGETTKNV